MRRMIFGLALVWIAVPLAWAQEDESPPAEEAPAYVPPPSVVPQIPQEPANIYHPSSVPSSPPAAVAPSSENEIQVFSPSGGASDVESGTTQEAAPSAVGGRAAPESYSIQSGDTLWDICQKLLDNPWYWPKLWSLNEYITNPHEIYPGSRLVFFPGSETAPPKMEVMTEGAQAAVPASAPAALTSASPAAPGKELASASIPKSERLIEIKLRDLSFISEKELKEAGEVTHSGETKAELTDGDHAFLKFERGQKTGVGDQFSVIKIIKKVSDPDTSFGSLGWIVRKAAVLKVIAIHKNAVEALVTDCDDSFTRGAKIIPFVSPIRKIKPHPILKEMNGQIVDAENQQYLIGDSDFVYVNLGKKQGLDDGSQLFVVRRGDGITLGDDKNLPDVIFGRLLIVETGDRVSTAYVTDVREALQIGDRVRSKME